MLEAVQAALAHRGIEDELLAAGQFMPRGHTGGTFLGAVVGDAAGGIGGDIAEVAGMTAGALAGGQMADARSGLPSFMLIGVSDKAVYGFAGRSRSKEPTELAFQVGREGLSVNVHQRANVRVLELIDDASGSRIELEGSRIPITHSKDVIDVLKT